MVYNNLRKVLLAALVLVCLKMLTHVSARPRDEERTQNEMGWGVGPVSVITACERHKRL